MAASSPLGRRTTILLEEKKEEILPRRKYISPEPEISIWNIRIQDFTKKNLARLVMNAGVGAAGVAITYLFKDEKTEGQVSKIITAWAAAAKLLWDAAGAVYDTMKERQTREHKRALEFRVSEDKEEELRQKANNWGNTWNSRRNILLSGFHEIDIIKKLMRERPKREEKISQDEQVLEHIQTLRNDAREITPSLTRDDTVYPGLYLEAAAKYYEATLYRFQNVQLEKKRQLLECAEQRASQGIEHCGERDGSILPFLHQIRGGVYRELSHLEEDVQEKIKYLDLANQEFKSNCLEKGLDTGEIYYQIAYGYQLRAGFCSENWEKRTYWRRASNFYKFAQMRGEQMREKSLFVNLSDTLIKMGEYKEAAKVIQPVLIEDPNSMLLHTNYAEALLGMPGGEGLAYKHYCKALELSRENQSINCDIQKEFEEVFYKTHRDENFEEFLREEERGFC